MTRSPRAPLGLLGSISLLAVGLLAGALLAPSGAWAADEPYVPEALVPWVDWVLEARDAHACPVDHDGERVCAWPGRLRLSIDGEGGRFEQSWRLKLEDWVPLPGGGAQWPQQVSADGAPVPVVEHEGRPAVRLAPGSHRLTGQFLWSRRPEVLPVPRSVGLVSLELDGRAVPAPRLDADGRLWLGGGQASTAAAEPDSLAVEVMRRIDDDIPLKVTTRLELDVSGQTREVELGPVALPGGIPIRIDSPLPARMVADGDTPDAAADRLQVQLRPGRWVLSVESYHPEPVAALTLDAHAAPWPEREVWAFAAHPDLRQVELRGADLVDPRQTRLPADWQRLPAYLLRPGETLTLEGLRRGALGADRVRLDRQLWLDDGAAAFSLRDRLSGQLEQRWRIAAEPILALGQVRVNGEPRFITRLATDPESGAEGVEVRQGRLALTADARILTGPVAFTAVLPASGWALPLDGAATSLHLPAGWDLLAVAGPDNLPDSWIARWSLLDIFLVLIAATAVGRLWGWAWGLVALLTLGLTWTEPGAPRWVWLHILAAAALLRAVPADPGRRAFRWLTRLLRIYYRGALIVLAIVAVPFLVTQVRDGLFPQLDARGGGPSLQAGGAVPRFDFYDMLPETEVQVDAAPSPAGRAKPAVRQPAAAPPPAPLPTLEPNALVQTGAGVPDWSGRVFQLNWSGPVPPGEQLRLWLLPPGAALGLALLQLLLVTLLGLKLAGWPRRARAPATASAGLLLVAAVLAAPAGDALAQTEAPAEAGVAAASAFPPPELLAELKRRLEAPPDCLPACADIPRARLAVTADALELLLVVDAAELVALPIPGSADGWSPAELRLDGDPLDEVRRAADGTLLALLPAGRHLLLLTSPLPVGDQLDIPLPLRPRRLEAWVAAPWLVEGIGADGRPGEQLRLLREAEAAAQPQTEQQPGALPPLLEVTRTLRLGLDWTLNTQVRRLSPATAPVTLRVPLVPGEAVTTPGLQVDDGRILVSLPPGRERLGWASTLTPGDRLTLTAAADPRLTEVWRLEVSPLWHLETSGLPPVQNLGVADQWLPTWRPWPGESLDLALSRPVGVPGPTLTLDRSRYELAPGRRATDATLELTLRSSQGGRHRLLLPEGAELTRLVVDGQPRPLALQGRALDLPLIPGGQQILLDWRMPGGLSTLYRPPVVDLGTPGVNADTLVRLGADRWLLWTSGPGVGPAVLFWGLLVVLALAAVVLARSRLTPLGFIDWLLLGIGLSQVEPWVAALVVLWLFALGLRRRLDEQTARWAFNLTQIGLVLLSIAALLALLTAVQQGLLGDPAMQVAGNGSSPTELRWYLDREGPQTVAVTVVSVSIWIYRALMLAWALWLAWRLLGWLRWGWQGLAEPELWRSGKPRQRAGRNGEQELSVDL